MVAATISDVWEATVRWIGILGIFAVIAATSADAQDATCLRQFEEADAADGGPAQGEQLLLMDNFCDAMKSEALRAALMRIPQEDENPVKLSFGVKKDGGMLRLKIPFSL